jgi:16S rRNA (guanine966-N2)-methyltransferase
VGGAWRGRPLIAPPGRGTQARAAVTAAETGVPSPVHALEGAGSLAGPLAGHAVLDVFAGSGGLGIEALSRGADSCTFVESAPPAVRALRVNLERLGVPVVRRHAPAEGPAAPAPRAVVLAGDVRRVLAADGRRGARYTLVFADPPYAAYEQVRPALVRLLGRVIVPGAVLVVESAAGTAPGLPWTVVREKRYGDTRVTFLVADAAAAAEGEAAD